ncbi:MAG: glycosyltransferase family 39 protein, partial [Candidatus Hydrogenedentes bacterium]|nr:glycosyltransferase family 39 protein [Candidatus Hydrogenedentota bacterium]
MKHIHVAALLALGLLLFGLNAGGYALWPADEPRFAEAAREMMLTGDYLVPRVNGEVYLEKPPLLFWLISLFSLPLGEVTEWSARMPSILSALAVILFTFLLARDWFGPRVGFWSALVLMTCVRFWWQARTAQIDMLLTACMMLSLWALWRWHTEHRARFLLAVYLGVALGLLAKGPPALVFPLLTMVMFYWRRKAERRRLHWALGLLAALVLVACWYVPARFAAAEAPATALEAGIGGNLFRNTLGRFLLGVSKFQPPWYYFETIPVDLFPWSLYLPWTLPWIWKHRRDSESIGFLLAWTVPALIFFSISLGKRAIYILPLFPAFAILLAASILALAESGHLTWQRRTGYAWGALLLLLGTAPFALPWTRYPEALSPEVTATGLLMLVLSAYSLRSARRPGVGLHLLMASQFAVVLLMGALFVLPAVDQYKSAKDITSPVRALSEAKADFDLFSVGFSSEEYLFHAR